MEEKSLSAEVSIPEGVAASLDNSILTLKSGKNTVSRRLQSNIKLEIKDSKILIRSYRVTQRDKKLIGSMHSHIKNMVTGILQGHKYTLKVCSGHFPMNVSVSGNKISVKNFLGEKIPRELEFSKEAKVTVSGDLIYVESPDKEIAGQTAAKIEQLTRRPGYDSRVFQDGCHIINKDGKDIK